ncbi:hypothetical protein CARUB_v10028636mg [Capsella rubella]|uniref:Disease resistance R13L4/SHOC-2-like LRR domain-containing protein n=1 Tax=Capsella rubella TaxID=81985 RepID=R0GER4_9BRAS|nr:uncharacterized protein LOC17876757 [Capsella rubella]EOA15239.1 hypothetical protein CARUB_v10028636mg [Capsella rubella]
MTHQECNIDKIIKFLSELQTLLSVIEKPPSQKATVDNNEQLTVGNNEQLSGRTEEKRSPWWGWIRKRVKKVGKVKKEASNHASESGGSQGGSRRNVRTIEEEQEDADLEIRKLQSDILQMITAFRNLTEFQTHMSKSLELDLRSAKLKAILQKTDSIRSRSHDIKEIRRKVFTLKCQIPSLLHKQSSRGTSITDTQTAEENDNINEIGNDIYLPGLHVPEDFEYSSAFEEVVEKFQGLDFPQKLCLLSFAVFPENREVERTMLMYWWISEGFINCDDSENSVSIILDEFSRIKLLEPVKDERKLIPSSYRMEPHVHSAVIHLAESVDLFKLYSPKGKRIMEKSLKEKVCLVRGSSLLRKAKPSVMKPETLKTVFNASERYPDFTFKWFPLMNSLRVLYLGRWERTAKRHIEVESTEFLKNMKTLKNLRLASFQGISRIEKLENSICALPELVILDLKACYNLEVLPSDIGLFEKLIYLDVSECYMLDRMPKGIAKLSRLQVLKGFVISESDHENDCAVKHLLNLRKLSITVNKNSFTVESLMESLTGLKQLESLKIGWGFRFRQDGQNGEKIEETNEAGEKDNQGGSETEKKLKDMMERDDEQVKKKGQASGEKKEEIEETGKQEDGVSNKKGSEKNEEADLEEGKKHDEEKAETLKSDKVLEEEKKTIPSPEVTETIQNKPDNQKGKNKVEEEGDANKGKADQEEGKKQDDAETSKSKGGEVENNTSPSQEATETIQKKPDDESKKENEKDRDKGKADIDEGKKQDDLEATKSKSDKDVEGDEKISPQRDEVEATKSKSDKVVEGDEKTSPQRDEVEATKSKSDKVVEGDEKTSPPQESKETIQNKTDDKNKAGNEGDGDKRQADSKEGAKHDEVEAGISKSDDGVEGVQKPSPSQDDHKETKVQEKRDGVKGNADLDEGNKKNEVKEESTKPDKVIEGDEKKKPPQESKETIQSETDDHSEISKVQENKEGVKNEDDIKKLDGGEANTEKSHKTLKFGKTVSFAEKSNAKKPDDLKNDNAMAEEIYETASPSRKSGSKLFKAFGNQTKKWGIGLLESQAIDNTSKLPSSLKKLELECFPEKDPPSWLNPKDLNHLAKLSIKGGKLSGFGDELPTAENQWQIQILRLKYLHEFKVEWKDLQELFPKMTLLEKYKCPKIAFCPTDGNGIWRKSPNM